MNLGEKLFRLYHRHSWCFVFCPACNPGFYFACTNRICGKVLTNTKENEELFMLLVKRLVII